MGLYGNMVYERNVETRHELLQRIFDVERRVNDAVVLGKVTLPTGPNCIICFFK